MARFPSKENDIVTLAGEIRDGLESNAALYDAPPISFDGLEDLITAYNNANAQVIAAEAEAKLKHDAKDDALDNLTDGMRSILNYAENKVQGDDAQLQLLGWRGRKTATEQPVPAQPRSLEIVNESAGTIELDWKQGTSRRTHGKVLSYKIECRELPAEGDPTQWTLKGIALESETILTGLPRGINLEFRVIAVNKTGDSAPSNVVAAVL